MNKQNSGQHTGTVVNTIKQPMKVSVPNTIFRSQKCEYPVFKQQEHPFKHGK